MFPLVTKYDRNFTFLIEDSLSLLFLSEASKDYDDMQLFARSSAFFSILILEAAANCLIDTLCLEKQVFQDIDRMSIIAKYDFYLRVRGHQNGLMRGSKLVQGIQELKSLRDRIVHPKKSALVLRVIDEETEHMVGEYKKTPILKISDHYRAWDTSDAVAIARTVHSFLQDYFLNSCGMKPEQSCAILYSEKKIPIDTDEDIGIPMILIDNKQKLNLWGIPTDYINFHDD
jgi:hypothetical protein